MWNWIKVSIHTASRKITLIALFILRIAASKPSTGFRLSVHKYLSTTLLVNEQTRQRTICSMWQADVRHLQRSCNVPVQARENLKAVKYSRTLSGCQQPTLNIRAGHRPADRSEWKRKRDPRRGRVEGRPQHVIPVPTSSLVKKWVKPSIHFQWVIGSNMLGTNAFDFLWLNGECSAVHCNSDDAGFECEHRPRPIGYSRRFYRCLFFS